MAHHTHTHTHTQGGDPGAWETHPRAVLVAPWGGAGFWGIAFVVTQRGFTPQDSGGRVPAEIFLA